MTDDKIVKDTARNPEREALGPSRGGIRAAAKRAAKKVVRKTGQKKVAKEDDGRRRQDDEEGGQIGAQNGQGGGQGLRACLRDRFDQDPGLQGQGRNHQDRRGPQDRDADVCSGSGTEGRSRRHGCSGKRRERAGRGASRGWSVDRNSTAARSHASRGRHAPDAGACRGSRKPPGAVGTVDYRRISRARIPWGRRAAKRGGGRSRRREPGGGRPAGTRSAGQRNARTGRRSLAWQPHARPGRRRPRTRGGIRRRIHDADFDGDAGLPARRGGDWNATGCGTRALSFTARPLSRSTLPRPPHRRELVRGQRR